MTASTRQGGSRQVGCGSTAAGRHVTTRLEQADGGPAPQEAESATESRMNNVRRRKERVARPAAIRSRQRGPHGRSSAHKGVTQHRRTRRWEAHIWDDRHQVYLGGFNTEEDAARAHDVMAMKCRGTASITNYSQDDYMSLYPRLQKLSKDEVRQLLMRKSSTFTRGVSKYRGVTKHKSLQGGKWEARLGHSRTCLHSYLGLFDSEEDAAKAYDTATISRFGGGVATNFDPIDYADLSETSPDDGMDECKSSSSETCKVVPSSCLDSFGTSEASSSPFDTPAAHPTLPASAFPTLLDTPPRPFLQISSFRQPAFTHMSRPSTPLPTHVGSPILVFPSCISSLNPFSGINSSTPDFIPHGSASNTRSAFPDGNPDRSSLPDHQPRTMTDGQTSIQSRYDTSVYTKELPAAYLDDSIHSQLGDYPFVPQEHSCLPGPAKLAADMHTLSVGSMPVNGVEELLNRIRSHGSQVMKYTDWQNQVSPAVPASVPSSEGALPSWMFNSLELQVDTQVGTRAEGSWSPDLCQSYPQVASPADLPYVSPAWRRDFTGTPREGCFAFAVSSGFASSLAGLAPGMSQDANSWCPNSGTSGTEGPVPCIAAPHQPLSMASFDTISPFPQPSPAWNAQETAESVNASSAFFSAVGTLGGHAQTVSRGVNCGTPAWW